MVENGTIQDDGDDWFVVDVPASDDLMVVVRAHSLTGVSLMLL